MTETEMGQLLIRIADVDHRTLDNQTRMHWQEIIGDVRYEDAVRAVVEHRRNSGEYLMPHHIVALTRLYQQERDREMRRLMEGRTLEDDKETIGKPAWFDEAVEAAAAATARCMAAGWGRSDDVTKRSAFAAADDVRIRFESEVPF